MAMLQDALKLYGCDIKNIKLVKKIDSTKNDEDIRINYIISVGDRKYVLKLADNIFTTPQNVNGWSQIAEDYRSIGIYTPKIIKNANGNLADYVEIGGCSYCVYLEEFSRYSTLDKESEDKQRICMQALSTMGKMAQNKHKLPEFNTSFVIYDKFANDKKDMNEEDFERLIKMIKEKYPNKEDRIAKIEERYSFLREKIKEDYQALPKCVFQGDLNAQNLLVDDNNNFVGLIDFNLSGKDTILNYLFQECASSTQFESEDVDCIMNKNDIKVTDDLLMKNLKIASNGYEWTKEEQAIFNDYYNMVMPFTWPNYTFFKFVLNNYEEEYADKILDWIDFQMNRDDLSKEFANIAKNDKSEENILSK